MAGLSLGCAPSPGPAPPPATVKPFAIAEVLPDSDSAPPQPPDSSLSPPDTFPVLPATDRATYESRAAGLLDTLRRAGSLLEWRRAHPNETIERAEDNREFDGGLGLPLEGAWCGRSVRRERLHDGRVVLRSVFFYPPQSATPVFEGSVGRDAIAECRAGAISLESEEPTSAMGDSLTLAVRRRLTSRYGQGKVGARLATWRASDWRSSAYWRLPAASVAAAAESSGLLGRVFVLAWGPSSGISTDLAEPETFRRDPETALLREIVALGRLDSVQAEKLIELKARLFWTWQGMVPETSADSMLPNALEPWVRAADTLPPHARSAALLLADRVLEAATLASPLEPDSTALRARLERSGARFEQHALGGRSYMYVNNWLWDAVRLDRDGPIGERALVVLLRHGLHTQPGCAGGGSQDAEFRRVIERGEQALAGQVDPALRAEIEELVAEAYGDIVYLASGGGYASTYFDPAAYGAEAPKRPPQGARTLRIGVAPCLRFAHSDEAAAGGLASSRRLAPLSPHFVCVYD